MKRSRPAAGHQPRYNGKGKIFGEGWRGGEIFPISKGLFTGLSPGGSSLGGNHQRGINAGLGARGRRAGFGDKSGGSRRRQPEASSLAGSHCGGQGHAGSWGQHAAMGGPAQPPQNPLPLP